MSLPVKLNEPQGMSWQTVAARVVPGHQVASGLNGNPRFPGGTLKMQAPVFQALGFDLTRFHRGTLNVSIAPLSYRAVAPPLTFRQVKWHPVEPAEDFSFFDLRVARANVPPVTGFIYFPHPETKPEHFQNPDVLELLLPYIEGISTGAELILQIPAEQMLIR